MRSFNLALLIVPPLILWMLVPAFAASTYSAITKGGVIGLYLSISVIGYLELQKSGQAERIDDITKFE